MILIHISILSLFAFKCYSVGPDYYAVNEDVDYKDVTIPETDKTNASLTQFTTPNISVNSESYLNQNIGSYSEDELEDFIARRKMPVTTHKVTAVSYFETTEKRNGTTYTVPIVDEIESNVSTDISPNILNDYEYVYDNEDAESLAGRQQLRHDSLQENNETQETESSSVFDDEKTTVYNNHSTRYFGDFYNLEPAVGKIDIEYYNKPRNVTNDTVWFVPEKYPCWDLPILYAELGKRRNTSRVFLLHASKLKRVIEEEEQDIPVQSKTLNIPPAQILNKWCGVVPCYGDSTLCVFADKSYSKICENDFKVYAPTLAEQIAVVNTVNSMRNRLARGVSDKYLHLPTAANMHQIIYDLDLENMAKVWLRQCLPGPAPCDALDGEYVTQLECTKYAEHCCAISYKGDTASKCIPLPECYVLPIIGCIHEWFSSAGEKLKETDIKCGHAAPSTYHTVQLIWAETYKIGCACGKKANGDVRVICNFAPGAPFFVDTKYYCGLIAHKDITQYFDLPGDITASDFLTPLGIKFTMARRPGNVTKIISSNRLIFNFSSTSPDGIYKQGWLRHKLDDYNNGTKGVIARLVTRYSFYEETEARCDMERPIYEIGTPASLCIEQGRRFDGLCYDFRDPTPGYRLIAVIAPAALFSLILYDLFSSVLRQTDY